MSRQKKVVFNCKVLWYVRAFHMLLERYVKMEATNAMLEQFLEPLRNQKHISTNVALSAQSDLVGFINRKITKTQLLEFLEQGEVLPFTFNSSAMSSWDTDEVENELCIAKAALFEYRKAIARGVFHYTVFRK